MSNPGDLAQRLRKSGNIRLKKEFLGAESFLRS
jgi:hypothetical protein